MNTISVEYKTSVKTAAGWRSVYMIAEAKKISEKRVQILRVNSIDGEEIKPFMSRTGANRQKYNGSYFASQEIDKKKNISAMFKVDGVLVGGEE